MKLVLLAAVLALTTRTAVADVSIADNNQAITVDCAKDKNVLVSGNRATVKLTGVCDRVAITGNRATVKGSAVQVLVSGNAAEVALEAADEVIVSGNNNTVSCKKGLKAKAPKVSNTGNDNKLSIER